MTSQRQISLFTEEQLTSLQVDSPANLIHPQESDSARRMRDTSGLRCLEQFERFSRPGLWAKTFAGLLIGMEGWYSTKCRLNWKLKATKSHRFYFQLVPLTHPTEETEFGLSLLKTPTAMDGQVTSGKANPVSGNSGTLAQEIMSEYPPTMKKLSMLPTPCAYDWNTPKKPETFQKAKERHALKGVNLQNPLKQMASMGLLPTPMASDATTGAIIGKNDIFVQTKGLPRKINQNGTDGSVGLGRLVQMLPTPTASDKNAGRRGNAPREGHNPMTNSLKDAINYQEQTSKCSQLSPQFVMEMMGFPIDWTLLPFLNGETNQSKQEETQ